MKTSMLLALSGLLATASVTAAPIDAARVQVMAPECSTGQTAQIVAIPVDAVTLQLAEDYTTRATPVHAGPDQALTAWEVSLTPAPTEDVILRVGARCHGDAPAEAEMRELEQLREYYAGFACSLFEIDSEGVETPYLVLSEGNIHTVEAVDESAARIEVACAALGRGRELPDVNAMVVRALGGSR